MNLSKLELFTNFSLENMFTIRTVVALEGKFQSQTYEDLFIYIVQQLSIFGDAITVTAGRGRYV